MKMNGLAKGILFGTVLLASVAQAQYGVPDLSDSPAAGTQAVVDGVIQTLRIGQQVMINNQLVTINEDTLMPRGARVEVDGKPAKVIEKRGGLSIGLYPGTSWFLGGAIPVDEFGTVEGGTANVWGTVISAEYRLPIKAPLSFTGWYYLPNSGASKDLYQLGLRYMFTPNIGFQVGYLDSTEADVDSATFQMVFKLASSCMTGNAWEISLLTGLYYNWSDFVVSTPNSRGEQGFSRKRTTGGFSFALQGGMQLTKTYSVLGSYWFVNDRNLNVSRLGIGFGVKF